ncbi:MAG: twin-arginine translocase subunit TatC [Candidatus Omnitrophota bacterium]|nr:twin-arginine translocase subunit TatC [Candidatus Omnitrophota bacterium]
MDKEFTFTEHLEELRRRIIISLIFIAAGAILAFSYAPKILALLKAGSSGVIGKLVFFDPAEAFMIHIKIAFFTGLVVSMPVLLYQLWAFLSPAIGENAKRHGLLFLSYSLAAFTLGASFAFFVLLPAAIRFLLGFSGESLEPMISVSNYVSFTLGLIVGCGLVFEMPVLSFILSKFGIVDHRFLRRVWKYAAAGIFIIAAVVTPTSDIFNMTVLALPMLFLYELSIWVSKVSGKKWV